MRDEDTPPQERLDWRDYLDDDSPRYEETDFDERGHYA